MRTAFALLALAGCRSILGIEDGTVATPSDTSSPGSEAVPIDTQGFDAPIGCPPLYQTLPNSGPRNHRYRLINTTQAWAVQRDACAADAGFLAFPDGPAAAQELAALNTFGGTAWLGIDDMLNEGSYRTSLNQPVSASTAALIMMSGNSVAQDCIVGSTSSLNDEDCNNPHKAICECVP